MEHDELYHALIDISSCTVAGCPVCIDQDESVLAAYVRALAGQSSMHLICDENTGRLCLSRLPQLTAAASEPIVIPAGEKHKHLRTCEEVWHKLIRQGADRRSVVMNVGGGMVTDLGGFCAATYLRGLKFIHIPTSLLAMCDAAAGGKQGVDFAGLKNYLGVIVQPQVIWIDTRMLETLPERELRNGLAEVLKHAIIADVALLHILETRTGLPLPDSPSLRELVEKALLVKKHFVDDDVREQDKRAALNFGHSFGHALEAYFLAGENPLLHGECVALGMILEIWLSHFVLGAPERSVCRRLSSLIRSHVPVDIPGKVSAAVLMDLLMRDKKNKGGELRFTLIKGPGEVVVDQAVAPPALREMLEDAEVRASLPWTGG